MDSSGFEYIKVRTSKDLITTWFKCNRGFTEHCKATAVVKIIDCRKFISSQNGLHSHDSDISIRTTRKLELEQINKAVDNPMVPPRVVLGKTMFVYI